MNVGDLICYNAAGQRKKTIGLILETHTRTDTGHVSGVDRYFRIYWIKHGDILPRAEWGSPKDKRHYDHGQNAKKEDWFKVGQWFEILN
jgi:hypothetical protein